MGFNGIEALRELDAGYHVPIPIFRTEDEGGRKPYPVIEVNADSMRVGKTTAVKLLAENFRLLGYPVSEFQEEWWENPFLSEAYRLNTGSLMKSQIWFLMNKLEQKSRQDGQSIGIQDLSPEGDYAYALTNCILGRLHSGEFYEYERIFHYLPWKDIPAPDLLIYLTVSDEGLIARAQASAREFETVDSEYFLTLKTINRYYLKRAKAVWPVLEVDTDELNFAANGDHKDEFFQLVVSKLRAEGWAV